MGQISTNPGSYNKELLIVEKKNDEKPFELHTTNSDKASYSKTLRNAWQSNAILFLVFAVWRYSNKGFRSFGAIAFGILGLVSALTTIRHQKRRVYYASHAKIEE